MTTRKKGVDQRCVDLAEHFMSDIAGSTQKDIDQLARLLQETCEDECNYVEEREGVPR